MGVSRACTCHTLLLQQNFHSSSSATLKLDRRWFHGLQLASLGRIGEERRKGEGGGGEDRRRKEGK